MKLIQTPQYLLLIDEEAYIKNKDIILLKDSRIEICSAVNDDSVWFHNSKLETMQKYCSKILAYYPLQADSKELDLPLLPGFERGFTITMDVEKLAKEKFPLPYKIRNRGIQNHTYKGRNPYKGLKKWNRAFIEGYKVNKKQFTLEDMEKAILNACIGTSSGQSPDELTDIIIKSLSSTALPTEFKEEYEDYEIIGERDGDGYPLWGKKLKTTTKDGKTYLVGEYKY